MSGVFAIGILLSRPASAALDTGLPGPTTGDTGGPIVIPESGHTGGAGGETGGTGTFTTGGSGWWYGGSGASFCESCSGAAELAGDPGGSPCDQGCSTGAGAPALLVLAPVVGLLRRQRQSRSYST